MPTVLFVCTANRYRSPIAEACFKRQLEGYSNEGDWEVLSAGTWTTDDLPPMPEAVEAAQRIGLDIQAHRSREISKELIDRSGLTLVVFTSRMKIPATELVSTAFRSTRPCA